ncbi:MAG: DUF3857 domain-containing protein, partial [Flavobacteriales bacterium]|nr:DUF3857 domain-containing protein [Flavobacteriales bacterium]
IILSVSAGSYRFSSTPDWVDVHQVTEYGMTDDHTTGYNMILFDRQERLSTEEFYAHMTYELLSLDGIQSLSPITIDYDPTYQSVRIHSINIIRDGITLDRSDPAYITQLDRETSLERHLYDGSKTIVVNLPDLRVGDILDYSYTMKGENPFFSGSYYGVYHTDYSIPIAREYVKIQYPEGIGLQWRTDEMTESFDERSWGNEIARIWDFSEVEGYERESDVPGWYESHHMVEYSSSTSWSELAGYIAQEYQLEEKDRQAAARVLRELEVDDDTAYEIQELIHFVQNDIRYLGFEQGINAYRPHAPREVLENRFGDCKDKSLTLCALLQAIGLEAEPILVHSYKGRILEEGLVNPYKFDHCVMRYKRPGSGWTYIDPTMSHQSGDEGFVHFPEYRKGLLLSEEGALIDLPISREGRVEVKDVVLPDGIGGGATYEITTTYYADEADYQIRIFNNNDLDLMQERYLDFASNLYPDIQVLDSLNVVESTYEGLGMFVTYEKYRVDSIWAEDVDGTIYLELYPLSLENLLEYDREVDRTMPLSVYPKDYTHTILCKLPEEWTIESGEIDFSGEDYSMGMLSQYNPDSRMLTLEYTYQVETDHIGTDEVGRFIEDNKLLMSNIGYYLTYLPGMGGFEFSWLAFVGVFILFALFAYLFYRLYMDYDPRKETVGTPQTIGSWLILPLLGLFIGFFRIGYQLITEFGLFNATSWSGYMKLENAYLSVILWEIVYNVALLSFIVLLLVLFFKRRTSLPILIVIFYAANLLMPFLDLAIVNSLAGMAWSSEEVMSVAKAAVAAGIWIPIFLVSSRVKRTFVKNRSEDDLGLIEETEPIIA